MLPDSLMKRVDRSIPDEFIWRQEEGRTWTAKRCPRCMGLGLIAGKTPCPKCKKGGVNGSLGWFGIDPLLSMTEIPGSPDFVCQQRWRVPIYQVRHACGVSIFHPGDVKPEGSEYRSTPGRRQSYRVLFPERRSVDGNS